MIGALTRSLSGALNGPICGRFATLAATAGLAAGITLPAHADQAEVDAGLARTDTPWIGEQVIVHLDLKTDGLSFANVFFDLPEVEGGFLMRPDTTTLKLTERRDGVMWQVLRYPLALFPQSDGELTVPAITVRFDTTQGYGSEPDAHELSTRPVTVTVRRPPGVADDALVVTTTRLDVQPDWTTPPDPVQAGDAFTLQVRRSADAISAMLLPPLPVYEVGGLAAYPKNPEVNDRSNRGALVGERVDRITWVVERAGSYRIPDIRMQWWNPDDERLQDITVPGVSFEAAPAPGQPATDTPASESAAPGQLAAWGLGTLLAAALLVLAWRFRATLHRWGRRILPAPRALLSDLNPGDTH